MRAGRIAACALLAASVWGCTRQAPPPPPPAFVPNPHYVLGEPYKAGGHWYYPQENYALDETGIASIDRADEGLTADGELRDPGALTASMQAIQLPAIVEVTNLENGRQIRVRVNDRGPASPARLIAVSPRAAVLLAFPPAGVARVRVRLDLAASHQAVDEVGGEPQLAIAAAPRAAIQAESLPPPGQGPAGPARMLTPQTVTVTHQRAQPRRLPEHITATYPAPGMLMIQAGSFARFNYANVIAAGLAGLGAEVVRTREGRQSVFSVQAGPFATIPQADAALAAALRAGVVDAHIVVQ
jgi:rare lipoprotein A